MKCPQTQGMHCHLRGIDEASLGLGTRVCRVEVCRGEGEWKGKNATCCNGPHSGANTGQHCLLSMVVLALQSRDSGHLSSDSRGHVTATAV